MKTSERQYYGAIALLLVYIAGVLGGVSWMVPQRIGPQTWFSLLFFGLLVAGILFGWAATRDSGAKKAPK